MWRRKRCKTTELWMPDTPSPSPPFPEFSLVLRCGGSAAAAALTSLSHCNHKSRSPKKLAPAVLSTSALSTSRAQTREKLEHCSFHTWSAIKTFSFGSPQLGGVGLRWQIFLLSLLTQRSFEGMGQSKGQLRWQIVTLCSLLYISLVTWQSSTPSN